MGDDSDVRISSDEVMDIAQSTRRFANGLGDNLSSPAETVPESMDAMLDQPSIPAAAAVVDVHRGANQKVADTLQEVKEELRRFATSLEKAVEDHDAVDRGVETALGLLAPFGGSTTPVDVKIDVSDEAIITIGEQGDA